MALPVTVDRIRRIVVAYLDEGAQTSETLAKRATKELGAAVDDETVDLILEQTSNCWEVGIDGYINPQIAFEGVTFTHRITAEEARTGAINALPNFVVALDLAAANIEAELVEKHRNGLLNLSDPSGGTDWLDAIVPVFPKLSPADLAWSVTDPSVSVPHRGAEPKPKPNEPDARGEAQRRMDLGSTGFISGPDGWLSELPGKLIGFTRVAGVWEFVGPIAEPRNEKPDKQLNAQIVAALQRLVEDGDVYEIDGQLAREIVTDIALGRKPGSLVAGVAKPISELFDVAGVGYLDGMLGPAGTDWDEVSNDEQDERFADGLGVEIEVARDVKLLSQQAMARWLAKKANTDDLEKFLTPSEFDADQLEPYELDPYELDPYELDLYELDPETNREEFDAVLAEWRALHAEVFATPAELVVALARPGVAEAIAPRLALLGGAGGLSAWLELFEELHEHTSSAARASVSFLLARITSEPAAADELLRSALALQPKFSAVFDEQIWRFGCKLDQPKLEHAFDNWIKSTGLIKRIERLDFQADPHEILRLGVLHQPKVTIRNTETAGRNDDCPCGSGKKYKKCHLGKSLPVEDSLIRPYPAGPVSPLDPAGAGRSSSRSDPSNGSNGSPGAAPQSAGSDLRGLVPRVQALQLLHLDRTQPTLVNAVADRLTTYGPSTPGLRGDTLNAVFTMALDAATWSEAATDDFIEEVKKTGAANRWGNELRALISSWTSTRVSVFQVLDRAYGVQLTLRDLRNGETYVVTAPETSKNYPIDSLMLSRVVFNSRAFQFAFGTLPVPDRDRDATLAMIDAANGELTPLDICDWVIGLRGRFGTQPAATGLGGGLGKGVNGAPDGLGDHRLRNTDSDVLNVHRCLYVAINSRGGEYSTTELAALLEAIIGLESQNENRWDYVRPGDHNHYLIGSAEIVRASRAEAKAAGVSHFVMTHTNSLKRHRELCRLLERSISTLRVFEETVDSAEDMQLGSELGLASPMPTPAGLGEQPEITPEIAAQIREQLAQRWLADSIPALGGLTPRQAADDPTRRDDLRRLLESFLADYEQPANGLPPDLGALFQMDPRRIADELGIKLRVK